MRASVLGIGWVTAAGSGRGRQNSGFSIILGALPAFSRKDLFAEPYPRFGRLDDFSKLGVAGIALALADAGLDQWETKRNFGVFAGTDTGCLETDLAYSETMQPNGGALASPNLFVYTLSNTFLGEAAIRFGLTGPAIVVNQAEAQGLECIRMAMESLAWGECHLALAGFCDLALPGTAFVVLGREAEEGYPAYGELFLDESHQLWFNGCCVLGWNQLIVNSLFST